MYSILYLRYLHVYVTVMQKDYCCHYNKKVMVVSCDVYRPAAIDQLRVLAGSMDLAFHEPGDERDPVRIAASEASAGAPVTVPQVAWDGERRVVHEWGTFTTVVGSDGLALARNRPEVREPLPRHGRAARLGPGLREAIGLLRRETPRAVA